MMRTILLSSLLVALSLPLCALAQDPAAPPAAPAEKPRKVFGLYMVCFANSVEFYKQEIELAQRHGIDGFLLDVGAWASRDPQTGKLEGAGGYREAAERMYQAAEELGTGFLYLPCPEYSVSEPLVEDMLRYCATKKNTWRLDGKIVFAPYGGSIPNYVRAMEKVEADGEQFVFLPFSGNSRHMMSHSFETIARYFRDHPRMDGWWFFAADGSVRDLIRINANARRATQFLDKLYFAGVCPAYNSANLRDYQGMKGYGAQWEGVIRDGADLVSLITWNDYNEDSALMPYRWKNGWDKMYFDRDESYLRVTAQYSAWYKSGQEPPITQDLVFFTYRDRSRWTTKAYDYKTNEWVDIAAALGRFDQIHDDVNDLVYLTTFLTAPADLTVQIGETKQTFHQPAGIAHATVPMVPGTPHVELAREGKTLLSVDGRRVIVGDGEVTKENSPRGYHLLNRNWAHGAVVGRPAATLEAAKGELLAGAEIVSVGDIKTVRNQQADGSGFQVPVKGLATQTYNVRIRYSNPSHRQVRLTLIADGAPRAENDYPYYIPAFLPPTKEGEFKTATFLWSLYDGTTFLKLVWMTNPEGEMFHRAGHPKEDVGSVLVDRIELIPVETVRVPQRDDSPFPKLVAIPGGSFTMGAKDGEGDPDERPAHTVTLAPFRMGRFEVTNAQFERFDPSHRQWRDGYSWRDDEPVIYVKWVDAARYCNWLSEQAGLSPVYELAEKSETTMVKDRKGNETPKTRTWKEWVQHTDADGFRLPSEAQWEYAATGRGENRVYPWGDDKPQPMVHGNFRAPAEAVDCNLPFRSEEASGTIVVGSFPAGASRDGVMDLAGNVSEWCSDWLNPYAPDAQTDPVSQVPANHRAIRGGSWGYYGLSQRAKDREFNNPNYPGYIYVGFRVVLPEASYPKLRKALTAQAGSGK